MLRLLTFLIAFSFGGIAVAADGPAAAATVEKLHAALLATMKEAEKLGYQGRFDRIAPALDETFNFPTIARVVTGRYWKGLAADKQAAFIETFRRLSAATYADNFDGYSGESFATLGEEDKPGSALVRTAIVKADGTKVSLNYVLNKAGAEWRIVNVIAEGVSDLSLKRSEYGAVIGKEGIDSLIAKLNAKIASYAAAAH